VEPTPATPAQSPAQRAAVSYTGEQLSVSATNSSLNQILREISRSTGIKITGGVAEERVFGAYGPGSASEVLASLLDGTGSNMILVQGSNDHATELILTPRTGGPTPPSPNSASFDSNNDTDDNGPTPRQTANPQPPGPPQPPSAQSQPSPSPVVGPIPPQNADGSVPSPTNTGGDATQESPNGVKTPQQIYDELMKLRRQQQQPQ
jgi:hypothetical protein